MKLRGKPKREKPRREKIYYTSKIYHEFNRVMLRLQALMFSGVRVELLDFWVISCEALEISDKQSRIPSS